LVTILLLILLAFPALGLAASPFDPPLKIRYVRLKADAQNPQAKRQVSCFYYRSIVVKQVDFGKVGADRLALLACNVWQRDALSGRDGSKRIVIPSDSWSGYFKGVKADFAFFEAPDGINGGLGFMVLRVYARKPLFQDTAQHGLQSIEIQEGTLRLCYQSVFQGSCSVVSAGTAL
jgi:hypothetical protein